MAKCRSFTSTWLSLLQARRPIIVMAAPVSCPALRKCILVVFFEHKLPNAWSLIYGRGILLNAWNFVRTVEVSLTAIAVNCMLSVLCTMTFYPATPREHDVKRAHALPLPKTDRTMYIVMRMQILHEKYEETSSSKQTRISAISRFMMLGLITMCQSLVSQRYGQLRSLNRSINITTTDLTQLDRISENRVNLST